MIKTLKLAKEIVENNQKSVIEKEKKFQEERDNDLKILKYNMQKAKKEFIEIIQDISQKIIIIMIIMI